MKTETEAPTETPATPEPPAAEEKPPEAPAAKTPPASAAASGLSPLEMARQQGAIKTEAESQAEAPSAETTPEKTAPEPEAEQPEADPALSKPLGKLDDLKVVEGIGPQIERILKEGGIDTWEKLSQADLERVQELLNEAGSRYRLAKPGTWPKQAAMAAAGQWQELREYQDWLDKGVEPTEG